MRAAFLVSALLAVTLAACIPAWAADLNFLDRVRAQEAIERVYYAHQVGAAQPFEQAVPRTLLERKVTTYLKQSAALERIWKTPVTLAMLDAELERMERQSRLPDRLRELYRALGEDPVRIRECLARPALAQRLSRSFFDFDQRIHQEARQRAEETRERIRSGWNDPFKPGPGRNLVRYVARDPAEASSPDAARKKIQPSKEFPEPWMLDPEDFAARLEKMSRWNDRISSVEEQPDAFLVRVLLKQGAREISLAVYRQPKETWEEWWQEVAPTLDEHSVQSVGGAASRPLQSGGAGSGTTLLPSLDRGFSGALSPDPACGPDNSWGPIVSPDQAPEPRAGATSVWTGSLMLVWGGFGDYMFNTGGRYDPAIDAWTPMSLSTAPLARSSHTAVWTGSKMIVWGGTRTGGGYHATGGRYDPVSDSWAPTSEASAPTARYNHTAVWTGAEMIVWGGQAGQVLQTGGRYNPATNAWTSTSLINAPTARYEHAAVWAGNQMVVWGGRVSVVSGSPTGSGGRYDPGTDSWQPTSFANAPEARTSFTAVSTGNRMLVWGGIGTNILNTGGRYDPIADTWSATSTINAPASRSSHIALWTGSRMIIWGGQVFSELINTGALYDPVSDSWNSTSSSNAPAGRIAANAVWTGSLMVVWGGANRGVPLNTGGRYDPAGDSWTPTSGGNDPSARRYHTSVWTGNELIIWGGDLNGPVLQTGARFDPATALWTPTSLSGAPDPRFNHTAVWTGSEMIVWGGALSSSFYDSGGRYEPVSDTWTATGLGPLAPRQLHTAVWTGSRMIVWGGHIFSGSTNTGARYNPVGDTWEGMSAVDVPVPREGHVAVWTGSLMAIWGGLASTGKTNTGGMYDLLSDVWTPTSLVNAPEGRQFTTAVWTGSAMIVWGGSGVTSGALKTGGRFDPGSNTWSLTSVSGAPNGRWSHSAVWTGSLMLVWGGNLVGGIPTDTGGRYEPVSDTWTAMPTTNAPAPRRNHSASWMGDRMLVWGGTTGNSVSTSFMTLGGLYCTCAGAAAYFQDLDADGFGDINTVTHACSQPSGFLTDGSDCNDLLPSSWSVPGESLNLAFVNGITMTWDPPAEAGGSFVFYDAIRSDTAASFDAPAFCILDAGISPTVTDPQQPVSGAVFNYLVRGRNNCPGLGPLGNRSDGTPRTAIACP